MRLHAPKHDVLIGMGCKWHYSLSVGYLLPFVSSVWIHYLYYTNSQKTRHANFKIKLHHDRAPSINFSTKKWLDNAVEICFKIPLSKAWPTVTYPYPQDSLPTLFPSHPELVQFEPHTKVGEEVTHHLPLEVFGSAARRHPAARLAGYLAQW